MRSTPLPAADVAQRLARIERVAGLLDTRFRIPLLGIPIGWDSLLGLVPGLGDAVTTVPAGWMIWHGHQMGARKRTLARMGVNAGIDLVIGAIPLVGDLFDIAFKSHIKNLALLQSEMRRDLSHAELEEVQNAETSQIK
ncbi:DUF4112 domain-containing protein [Marivita sp.]|uniref:DUF4112 domain-containing protein n=1 Tax=Marivita sp. TaxID=2003365 RepID=UPI0025BA1412|nr:DUF4112 domain-containing protein [Marivita sp.]